MLLFALALLAPAQPDDAAGLYRRMTTAVEKAEALDIGFELAIDTGEKEVYRGSMLVAKQNRVRIEVAEVGKQRQVASIVSDGVKVFVDGSELPAPAKMANSLKACFGKAGVYATTLRAEIAADPPADPADLIRTKAFRVKGREAVMGRTAAVVEHRLEVGKAAYDVTVWIDVENHLPLKRVVTSRGEDPVASVTETYTRVVLDGKLDASAFDAPGKR